MEKKKKTDASNCLKRKLLSRKMLKTKLYTLGRPTQKPDRIERKTFILLSRETQRQRESRPLKLEAALHKKWRQNKLTSEGK